MKPRYDSASRWILVLFFCAVCAVLAPQGAFSQESALELFADGVVAFEEQDYKQAEASIKSALQMEPENDQFLYHLALVYSKTCRKTQAVEIFERLIASDSVLYRKAYYDIAAIYSAQSQHEKALQVLKRAIDQGAADGRAHLEAAVAAKNLKKYNDASNYAKEAKDINPLLAPPADNLLAVIAFEQDRFDEARLIFGQIMSEYPNSALATAAAQSLKAVDAVQKARKPWFVHAMFLVGFDDNVISQPLGPLPAQPPTGKGDSYQNLVLTGGYRFINERARRAGAGLTINHIGFKDLANNNIVSFNPFAFYEKDFDRFNFSLRYDLSYYYTGGEPAETRQLLWYLSFSSNDDKLVTHRAMPRVLVNWTDTVKTDLAAYYLYKHYMDDTPDANAYMASIAQIFPIGRASARVGYTFHKEDSGDKRLSSHFHQTSAGLSAPLVWKIHGSATYSFISTHYEEKLTDGSQRRDKTHRVDLSLTRPLLDWLGIGAAYGFTNNDSDRVDTINGAPYELFDFRRRVYMLWLNAHF
jgi:tetratricopeptide (TPR) repeat protein